MCRAALLLIPAALAALAATGTAAAAAAKPNIVWFLTDDQDQMLGGSFPQHGGVGPLPKTKALMQEGGAMATNFFIHTPICCPSRSELVTGMYFHNIKQKPGSGRQGACMHTDDLKVQENTFAKYLAPAGYTVGLFGKYLNNWDFEVVPPGFSAWAANGGGDYFGPQFQTKNAGAGIPDGSYTFPLVNYTTSVVGNLSIEFIQKAVASKSGPFFAYVAPKATHEPFNPAPWYRDAWEPGWPAHEPRPVSWNCSAASRAKHHGNIATEDMMTVQEAAVVTGIFKNRWRVLMSVDDVIAAVIKTCEELGVVDSTYFFYSSECVRRLSPPARPSSPPRPAAQRRRATVPQQPAIGRSRSMLLLLLLPLVLWQPRLPARGVQHSDGQAAAVRL
eukprot:SAG22_NODE_311_length_12629_cov_20.911891_2_plen_389_part_00